MNHTKANFLSLLPFLIFVGTFLGAGIVLQDFYALPSPIAVSIGIIAALAGLFMYGIIRGGAQSWYDFGFFNFQPFLSKLW